MYITRSMSVFIAFFFYQGYLLYVLASVKRGKKASRYPLYQAGNQMNS